MDGGIHEQCFRCYPTGIPGRDPGRIEAPEPDLLEELRGTQEPTNDQSDAVVRLLIHALSKTYGPGHIPNEYGKRIDNAIGAYYLAWPKS